MSFLEIVKDDNITLCVLKAIRRYQDLGAFSKVLEIYSTEWKSISPVAYNYERAQNAAKAIVEEPLVNFRTLSILSIWVDAGTAHHGTKEIDAEFGGKVSEILAGYDLI